MSDVDVPPAHPVSLTAQWMAAERARETARPDALFWDPYAAALAGPEGERLLARMSAPGDGTGMTVPIRTRFFDDALLRLLADGQVRQVVVLAAGMDARAFRLPLPAGVRFFELDRPEVLAVKEDRLAGLGARASVDRTLVRADLSGDWAAALVAAGLHDSATVWLVEGLLMYLDAGQIDRLLGTIGGLAHAGDALLTDFVGRSLLTFPPFAPWLRKFTDEGMPMRFGTDDPEALLAGHGWDAQVTRYGDDGAHFGRWTWPPVPRGDNRWPQSYLVKAHLAVTDG